MLYGIVFYNIEPADYYDEYVSNATQTTEIKNIQRSSLQNLTKEWSYYASFDVITRIDWQPINALRTTDPCSIFPKTDRLLSASGTRRS
jgi:hypothetical protein